MSGNYYYSSEHFWSNERFEHRKVDEGIRVLSTIDKELQRAFEVLESDDYGQMSRLSYNGIAGRIKNCKEKNSKVWNYASLIHGVIDKKEDEFHRALSEALEEISFLNINDYEVDNKLGIKEFYSSANYSGSSSYQGTSNVTVVTAERLKAKINFADIMAKTDTFQLNEQFEKYLKDEKKNINTMSDAEIAKYKDEFYDRMFDTSFDHKMYSDVEGLSEFLDYIPLVGGAKGILEGISGYTMTGEKLTTSERFSKGVLGTVSLAVDVVTLGSISLAANGTKALITGVSKFVAVDVLTGYGTKFTSEAMLNLGMSPEAVMITHIIAGAAVGKYTQHRLNKELNGIKELSGLDNIDQVKDVMKYSNLSTKDLEKLLKNSSIDDILGISSEAYRKHKMLSIRDTIGLDSIDQVDDILKHTGLSADDLNKLLKTSSIESILGIDDMNLNYLIKNTNMSSADILNALKNQGIELDQINQSNVDRIIKKLNSGAKKTLSSIDAEEYAFNAIKGSDKADNVVLGKYEKGSAASYDAVAKDMDAQYFNLDNWDELSSQYSREEIWKINEKFLDIQTSSGREIYLSHNPAKFLNDGSFYSDEIQYLIDNGYKFVKEGDLWHAIR